MNPSEPPKPVQTMHGESPRHQDDPAVILPKKLGRLLRLPSVEERTGFKKSSVYAGVKAGTFPAPVRLSARAVAWREEDLDKWVTELVKVGAV